MSLLRLILFCVFVWLIWRWWQHQRLRQRSRESGTKPVEFTAMVRCAQCGVHLPRDQSVPQQALNFCSQQHADLYNNTHHG